MRRLALEAARQCRTANFGRYTDQNDEIPAEHIFRTNGIYKTYDNYCDPFPARFKLAGNSYYRVDLPGGLAGDGPGVWRCVRRRGAQRFDHLP